ncbi:MAG: flavin reductase family protein [Acidimicrobiia bacterium]|nr:flavin reductase family protein [Acidimicrobiia bacterium]
MGSVSLADYVSLDPTAGLWERVFTVAPLVLIGTLDLGGEVDLAPKHMVAPMGWGPYFGFVCTPRHGTYRNVEREGTFTVSYLRPDQIVLSSLTAAPRCEDDSKPIVAALDTFPAANGRDVFVAGGYFYLECRTERMIDGFEGNSLVVGEITAAYADEAALRISDGDDQEAVERSPLLAYLAPGRWSEIRASHSFPFPVGFER